MREIFNEETEEAEVEYWKRLRTDIGKFDRIIANNFVQHMTLIVSLMTLSAYIFQGNPNLSFLSGSINVIVVIITFSFRKQNGIYQKLIKKNIEFTARVESKLFKNGYGLTDILAKSLSSSQQRHTYTNCYIVMIIIALGISIFFFCVYFIPEVRSFILNIF